MMSVLTFMLTPDPVQVQVRIGEMCFPAIYIKYIWAVHI